MKMNLIICGDFENGPFALEIDNPSETLIFNIKEKVADTLDVPAAEILLYFSDGLLEEDSLLSQWKDLRDGAAVFVVANPLKITLHRYCSDIDLTLEIPRLAAPRWPTDMLFEFCLYKAGMPHRKDGKYIYAVKGMVLKEGKRMSDYKFLSNNFTISVTFIQSVHCCDSLVLNNQYRTFYVPPGSCIEKSLTCEQKQYDITSDTKTHGIAKTVYDAQGHFKFGNSNSHQYYFVNYSRYRRFFSKWKLTIQQMDGTKKVAELENHFFTPVHELRKKMSPNSRLTFGRTVLEDWDSEGNMMLLCNYPDIHDGATLYQINLTGAIRVKFRSPYRRGHIWELKLHNQLHEVLEECFMMKPPEFIFIEDPNHFTVNRLIGALKNCGMNTQGIFCNENDKEKEIVPSNDAISSVDSIYDNCNLICNIRPQRVQYRTIYK